MMEDRTASDEVVEIDTGKCIKDCLDSEENCCNDNPVRC